MPASEKIQPNELDTREAVDFLRKLDPHGRHNLVAIEPETGSISGRTFEPGQFPEMQSWIDGHNGHSNCYFSVNEPRAGVPHSKLRKCDIVAVRALHVDIDPRRDADPDAERIRLRKLISEGSLKPTFAVDSGGGVQAFWKLSQKIAIPDGPGEFEQMNRAAAALFGEGDATQNIERIMRLPGTINIPNVSKRAKGRTERRASMLWSDGPVYEQADLASMLPAVAPRPSAANDDTDPRIQRCIAEISASDYQAIVFNDLPSELRSRFDGFLDRAGLREFWETHDDPGSEKRFELARHLKRDGTFSAVDYARLAWIWPRSTSRPDIDSALSPRALARDWVRCWTSAAEEFEPVEGIDDEPSDQVTASPCRRSKILNYAQMISMPAPQWLIRDVLQRRTAGLLFGKSNVFKSFTAIDLGLAVATGRPWHGQPTEQGNVVFVATEGANGVGRLRVPGWFDHYQIPATERRAFLYPEEIALDRKESVDEFIRELTGAGTFSLIVLDIFAGTMLGSEIEDTTARAWVNSVQRLIRELGVTVLTVAHTGWHDETRARMHTHFWGSFDTRLKVEGDKDKRTACLTVNRHKDADSSGEWGFSLSASCGTLIPILDDSVAAQKQVKWRQVHKTALAALNAVISERGATKTGPGWPLEPVVAADAWKDVCPDLSTKGTPDARRMAFTRARDFLLEVGAIQMREDFVWVPLD